VNHFAADVDQARALVMYAVQQPLAAMTTTPAGYTTVAPWIVTEDTGALLDFITTAFDGAELGRVPLGDGSIGHAEIRVGDTVLLAFDQRADWPGMPALLRVFVPDADAAFDAALRAGAREVTALSDNAFGQRGARVRDPVGNIWWITAIVETVDPEEGMRRLDEPRYQEQMRFAQETLDAELSGRARGQGSPVVTQ
jgi:PhnB protein